MCWSMRCGLQVPVLENVRLLLNPGEHYQALPTISQGIDMALRRLLVLWRKPLVHFHDCWKRALQFSYIQIKPTSYTVS